MAEFVLVRHANGLVGPIAAATAKKRGMEVVEGDAVRPDGRQVRPVRENGRPAKARTTVEKSAAKKASGGKSSPEQKAVTPTEGAADTTLTESNKE